MKRFNSTALVPYLDSMYSSGMASYLGVFTLGASATAFLYSAFSTKEALQNLKEDISELRGETRNGLNQIRQDTQAGFQQSHEDIRELRTLLMQKKLTS